MTKLFFFVFLFVFQSLCYNNGVGFTPAMGWNSWNQFGCDVDEDLILQTADGIISLGLDKLGYKYVNIDDCWQLEKRDDSGKVVVDPQRFPNGMKHLVDEIHSKGLKLGLYTDIGLRTCQGRAGSYKHYDADAQTYAEWGIDYIKVDYCYTTPGELLEPWKFYSNFSSHINETGRHILFSICNWGVRDPWKWAPAIANSWRTTGDIKPTYKSMISNMETTKDLNEYAGNYNFNDPDMLEIGVKRGSDELSITESKTHFSLWAMMSSPLLLGLDLRTSGNISSSILNIISKKEVIDVNQDSLGKQGQMIKKETSHIVLDKCVPITTTNDDDEEENDKDSTKCKYTELWKKELSNNRLAVLMFNRADVDGGISENFEKETMQVSWEELGVPSSQKYTVYDLWNSKNLGIFSGKFVSPSPIEQHDVLMLTFVPVTTMNK